MYPDKKDESDLWVDITAILFDKYYSPDRWHSGYVANKIAISGIIVRVAYRRARFNIVGIIYGVCLLCSPAFSRTAYGYLERFRPPVSILFHIIHLGGKQPLFLSLFFDASAPMQ